MTHPPEQPPTEHTPPAQPGPSGQPTQPGPFAPPPQWPVAPAPGPGQFHPPAGGYGAPMLYQQKSSGGAGKVIAIVVGIIALLAVLVCGGAIALFAWGANNIEEAFDEFDPGREGGRDNPISLEVGEDFEIDGIEYADGWRVVPPADEYSRDSIAGLKGTNDRDDGTSESVFLTFTFIDGDDIEVGEVSCHSNGNISHGNTEELDCNGRDRITESYDHVEVAASY